MALRKCYLDIEAWQHNIHSIQEQWPEQSILLPIKANAYGHGLSIMIKAIDDRVSGYWVATLEEAKEVRLYSSKPICVAHYSSCLKSCEMLLSLSCDLVIYDIQQINTFHGYLPQFNRIWLKVNTGMNRLGVNIDEYQDAMRLLKKYVPLEKIGLLTHLADTGDTKDNRAQLDRFRKICKNHHDVSWSNSSGLGFLTKETMGNWIRPGLLVHGICLDDRLQYLPLKPVMSLWTEVIQTYEVGLGDQVGYDGQWVAQDKTQVAIVSLGYADGFPQNCPTWSLYVKGVKCNVIGKVSMDVLCIDVSGVDQVFAGDKVEIIGPSQTLTALCRDIGESPYALITRLGSRFERIVLSNERGNRGAL
ncbi:MAG: alanine racemase [Candidatus Comchoanobacterales bacterium]